MQPALDWGLTICTCDRPQFLLQSLKYALNQTRPPAEIVVVDASEDWQGNHRRVSEAYAEKWNVIRLVYQQADVRSLPYQRNQALGLSTCSIVFSLDDDIYLYPDAAEIIMRGYETDDCESVAMIGGHFVGASPEQAVEKSDSDLVHENSTSLLATIKSRFESLLSLDHHFVPYDQPVSEAALPDTLEGIGILPSGLVNGGRTTFRRKYGCATRWNTMLRYYATHEDSDFSYRMSLCGRLAVAPNAKFFHADGNERRLNRYKVNKIRVCNLMALHRVSSTNRFRSLWRLLLSFTSFAALYLLIDLVQRRFSLPIVRAYLVGVLLTPVFLFYPFADFRDWYSKKQEELYRAR